MGVGILYSHDLGVQNNIRFECKFQIDVCSYENGLLVVFKQVICYTWFVFHVR